jgi:hypothetical protein
VRRDFNSIHQSQSKETNLNFVCCFWTPTQQLTKTLHRFAAWDIVALDFATETLQLEVSRKLAISSFIDPPNPMRMNIRLAAC